MPRNGDFCGIAIYMYYRDHVPPHIHAIYADCDAEVLIETGDVFAGTIPRTAALLVKEWVARYRTELSAEEGHDLLLNPATATSPPAKAVEMCRSALIKAGATGPVTVLEQPVVAPDEPWDGAPARGVVWIEVASSGWPIKGRSKGFAYVLESMPPGGQVVGNLNDAFSAGRTQRRREYRRIDDRWFIYAAPQ